MFLDQFWVDEFEVTRRDVLQIVSNTLNLADPAVSEAFKLTAAKVAREPLPASCFSRWPGRAVFDQEAYVELSVVYYRRVPNLVALVLMTANSLRERAIGTTFANPIFVD